MVSFSTDWSRQLFQEQVERWRTLDHDNILRLYGTAMVDGTICSVSPWFESVMAQTYVQERTASDRIRILADVASGMAYLHANDVAHGDLRGVRRCKSSTAETNQASGERHGFVNWRSTPVELRSFRVLRRGQSLTCPMASTRGHQSRHHRSRNASGGRLVVCHAVS